jgi:predicted transcriptional regulator
MKKHLSVAIKGADESAKEFVEAWRRAKRGKPPEQPIERLYFEDLATMLKVLTPRRLEVLKVLHEITRTCTTIFRYWSESDLLHDRPMAG